MPITFCLFESLNVLFGTQQHFTLSLSLKSYEPRLIILFEGSLLALDFSLTRKPRRFWLSLWSRITWKWGKLKLESSIRKRIYCMYSSAFLLYYPALDKMKRITPIFHFPLPFLFNNIHIFCIIKIILYVYYKLTMSYFRLDLTFKRKLYNLHR